MPPSIPTLTIPRGQKKFMHKCTGLGKSFWQMPGGQALRNGTSPSTFIVFSSAPGAREKLTLKYPEAGDYLDANAWGFRRGTVCSRLELNETQQSQQPKKEKQMQHSFVSLPIHP